MKEKMDFIKMKNFCSSKNAHCGQLMFKRPELPYGFQGRVFKGNIWFECCSSWTFF